MREAMANTVMAIDVRPLPTCDVTINGELYKYVRVEFGPARSRRHRRSK